MWRALNASTDGGMTPLERATILAVPTMLLGLVAMWVETDSSPERVTSRDLLAFSTVNVAIGLASSCRLWVRSLAVGALGALILLATNWGIGRPYALATGFVVSNVINSILQAELIGAIDLPLVWRRWCAKASSQSARWTRWSAYYGATWTIWFLLLLSADGLVDAAVNVVLPVDKLAKSLSEVVVYVACLVVGGGSLLLAHWLAGAKGSGPIRVARPALVAAIAVVLLVGLIELLKVAYVFLGIYMPPVVVMGEIVDTSEDARRWTSDPREAIGQALAVVVALFVPAIPIGIALTAWWDHARAQNRRSRLISTLACLALVTGCTALVGVGSMLVLKAATGQVTWFGNWAATLVGFGVGVRLSYLLLRSQWGKGPSPDTNLDTPMVRLSAT